MSASTVDEDRLRAGVGDGVGGGRERQRRHDDDLARAHAEASSARCSAAVPELSATAWATPERCGDLLLEGVDGRAGRGHPAGAERLEDVGLLEVADVGGGQQDPFSHCAVAAKLADPIAPTPTRPALFGPASATVGGIRARAT